MATDNKSGVVILKEASGYFVGALVPDDSCAEIRTIKIFDGDSYIEQKVGVWDSLEHFIESYQGNDNIYDIIERSELIAMDLTAFLGRSEIKEVI